MQPNQDNPQLPADYLDQIAPKPTRGSGIFGNKPLFLGMIALILVLLVCIVVAVANMAASNIKPTERLAARLVSTKDTVDKSTANIKSTKLNALNSALSVYLTDTIRDIKPILESSNIKIDKLSKNATYAESNEELMARLEDARLNARFDRVYANEMSTQLENTIILMRQIHKSTNSSKMKSFVKNAYDTLVPTQKEFAEFNDTNS